MSGQVQRYEKNNIQTVPSENRFSCYGACAYSFWGIVELHSPDWNTNYFVGVRRNYVYIGVPVEPMPTPAAIGFCK